MVGLRNFGGMWVFSAIQAISQLTVIYLAIGVLGLDINGALRAAVSAGLITIGIEIVYFIHRYGLRLSIPQWRNVTMVVGYGLRHHVARFSNVLNNRMGAIILAFFATRAEIGYFILASSLMGFVVTIPTALTKALLPRVAADENGKADVIAVSAKVSGIVCGGAIVLILILREPLVTILFSTAFAPAIPHLLLLAPGVFIRSMTKVMVPYFNGINKPQITTYAVGAGITVNVALVFSLYPILGVSGAAIAMTAGYFVSGLISIYFFNTISGIKLKTILIPDRADLLFVSSRIARAAHRFR